MMKKLSKLSERDSCLTCGVYFHTFAAFGVVAEPVMSVSAAVAALPLHVGFTAALTSNETSVHVCHSVTYSPVQRAHWVTVTGCRRNISMVRSKVLARIVRIIGGATGIYFCVDSPSQMLGSLMSLSGCWK